MPSPDQIKSDLEKVERIATLMDGAFHIPGTRIKFGWDSIIGLVPAAGDLVAALPLFYFVAIGWKHKVPKRTLILMICRQVADTLLGSVPIVGDLFDVAYRSNQKNAHALHEALAKKLPQRSQRVGEESRF